MRMARTGWILVLTVLLAAWAFTAVASENPFKRPAPFKSAIIKYKYSGSQTGSSTVYFKGMVQAEHKRVSTKIMGMDNKENLITISEPKRITTVDMVARKASYTGNYLTYLAQEYDKLSPAEKKRVKKNAETMGSNFAQLAGGKPEIKKGSYMKRPVDIVTIMGISSYSWRGKHIVLKQQGNIMGMRIDMHATDISVGAPVPADKLRVPAGITPVFDKEQDQRQRRMAKRIMAMLKDPESGKGQGGSSMETTKRQAVKAENRPSASDEQGAAPQSGKGAAQEDTLQKGLKTFKKILNW